MKNKETGPNAVGHNSVVSAVTTALFDMISNKGQLPLLKDDVRIDGKTCFVTGANSGLGKAIAIQLAKRGGHIIMACRSGHHDTCHDIKKLSGSNNVEMVEVDLSDMNSVSSLCDQLRDREISIDIAVMNAGLMPLNSRRSAQGFELMFAVHFLANRLMIDRMIRDGVIKTGNNTPHKSSNKDTNIDTKKDTKKSDVPRIIFVSSEAHQSSDPINFDRFGEYTEYGLKDGLKFYGTSKLYLSTFANELSRQLNPDDGSIQYAVHSLCPGPIASNIARESPGFIKPILSPIMRLFFNSPEKAANPVMLLACADSMGDRTGAYLHMMREKACSLHASDSENGKKLWDHSQQILADFITPNETQQEKELVSCLTTSPK